MRNFRLLLLAATALFIAFKTLPARAADASSPALIVASPGVTGPYAQTVVVALPAGNGTHLGIILNRPVRPDAAVYYGGPDLHGPVFALVRSARPPTPGSLEVLPGLFMVFLEGDVERLIARASPNARFYVGLVTWDGGELELEMRAGLWHALEPQLDLVLDTNAQTLWSRLMTQVHSVRAMQR